MRIYDAKVKSLFMGEKDNTGDVSFNPVYELNFDAYGIIGNWNYDCTHTSTAQPVEGNITKTSWGQISIVTLPELASIADYLEIPEVNGSDLGANIVLDGPSNLTSFPAGAEGILRFSSGVFLNCRGQSELCTKPQKALAKQKSCQKLTCRVKNEAPHLRGILAIVGAPGQGVIKTGDTVELFYPTWSKWEPQA